jgi:hypothetical protein
MPKNTEHDIFLSYSFKDRPWVTEFVSALNEAGIRTWFDVQDIAPGERLGDKVQQALRESRTIVVILSKNSLNNPNIFFELGAAIADHKRIIPVLVEEIDLRQLPLLLTNFQFLKEPSPIEAGKRIAQVIEKTSLEKIQPAEV